MIEVTHDGEPKWMTGEKCCFCQTPTRYWFAPKDVAVCKLCAAEREAYEVPSKREWINAGRKQGAELLPPGWKCNADRRAEAAALK